MYHAAKDALGEEAELVWYQETALEGYNAILIPGGFSYGDYLRCGAIASTSEIVKSLHREAEKGTPILGVCNGFQILLETGLLPGALLRNKELKFICQHENLIVQNNKTLFTSAYQQGQVISIPIAHGEGNYFCDDETLASLKANNQIVFSYQNNPNGSVANIAGIINQQGNVLGMMPHPERATELILGSEDGLNLFKSMLANWRESYVTNA